MIIQYRQPLGQSSIDILSLSAGGLPSFILDAIRDDFAQKLYFDVKYVTRQKNCDTTTCCEINPPVVTGDIDESIAIDTSFALFHVKIKGHARTFPKIEQFIKTVTCQPGNCANEKATLIVSVKHDFDIDIEINISVKGEAKKFDVVSFDIGNGESTPTNITEMNGEKVADISFKKTVIKTEQFSYELDCGRIELDDPNPDTSFVKVKSAGPGIGITPLDDDAIWKRGCHFKVTLLNIVHTNPSLDLAPDWTFVLNINGDRTPRRGVFMQSREFLVTSNPNDPIIYEVLYHDQCGLKFHTEISVLAICHGPDELRGGGEIEYEERCSDQAQNPILNLGVTMSNGDLVNVWFQLDFICASH